MKLRVARVEWRVLTDAELLVSVHALGRLKFRYELVVAAGSGLVATLLINNQEVLVPDEVRRIVDGVRVLLVNLDLHFPSHTLSVYIY